MNYSADTALKTIDVYYTQLDQAHEFPGWFDNAIHAHIVANALAGN